MSKQGDVIDQLDRVVKLFTHPKTPFVFLFFPITAKRRTNTTHLTGFPSQNIITYIEFNLEK